MTNIFLSYRREDSQGSTGRLADALKATFAQRALFRDVETIGAGADFAEAIEEALGSCIVLLAVIGPRWLTVRDKSGKRRIDDPRDYVRLEITTALARDMRIIPILVDGARMPDANDLPDQLKPLARLQAFGLSDRHWGLDVQELTATLKKELPEIERRNDWIVKHIYDRDVQRNMTRKDWILWAIAALLGLAASIWWPLR